jgi:hypothetical protein
MTDKDTSVSLCQEDFEAIQTAVMETARGRWFLAEFAKRNRTTDTDKVMGAIERLEGMMRNGRIVTGPDNLQAELVTLTARIAQAKMEIVAHANSADSHESMVRVAVRALHRVEGRVSDIAEDLRRSAIQMEEQKAAAKIAVAPPVAAITETVTQRVPLKSGGEQSAAVAVSSSRLSALEDLANRALSLKKAQFEPVAAPADAPFIWPTRKIDAAATLEPAVRAPLMQPPEPVNDDREPMVAAQEKPFNPDWEVRSTQEEKDHFDELPMPQVAVAGQSRSAGAVSRGGGNASSYFMPERSPASPLGNARTSVLESGAVSFATPAAASKATLATQAVAERVRAQVEALKNQDQALPKSPEISVGDAKDRFTRHWEPAFRAPGRGGDEAIPNAGAAAGGEAEALAVVPDNQGGVDDFAPLRPSVNIRDIDGLSFEEKAVYFA